MPPRPRLSLSPRVSEPVLAAAPSQRSAAQGPLGVGFVQPCGVDCSMKAFAPRASLTLSSSSPLLLHRTTLPSPNFTFRHMPEHAVAEGFKHDMIYTDTAVREI